MIRFRDQRGIDFPYLAVDDSRLVHEPGDYAGLSGRRDGYAMQLIFTPMMWRLIEQRKAAMGRG